jgi:hypothetical protein
MNSPSSAGGKKLFYLVSLAIPFGGAVAVTLGAPDAVFFVALLVGFVLAEMVRRRLPGRRANGKVRPVSLRLELSVLAFTFLGFVALAFVFDAVVAYVVLGGIGAWVVWTLIAEFSQSRRGRQGG